MINETDLNKSIGPQYYHEITGTRNGVETGSKQIFGLVYGKRDPKQKKETNNSLLNHESNLNQVQDSSGYSQSNSEKDPQSKVESEVMPFKDLDVPIAIRKGNRSCKNHPISKFVSTKIFQLPFLRLHLKFLV